MLKKLVVAAIAFVVLAAAAPSYAQCHPGQRYYYLGNTRYECTSFRGEPNAFEQQFMETQMLVPNIWAMSDDVTDARVNYEQDRRMRDRVRDDRGRYDYNGYDRNYGRIPYRPSGHLGMPYWGGRYPWNDCRSWNRQGCRRYTDAEMAAIWVQTGAEVWSAFETHKMRKEMQKANEREERYSREERSRPDPRNERGDEPEARIEPKAKTLVNMTNCKAKINGESLSINGHMSIPAGGRIFAEVESDTCDKYLENIGEGVVALKCR